MVAQAVAPVGRRTFPSGGVVTLTAGEESRSLIGREAAMLVELALAANFIRPLERGRVTLDFTEYKVTLSVTRADAPLHIEAAAIPRPLEQRRARAALAEKAGKP